MPENKGSGLGASEEDLLVRNIDRPQMPDRFAHPARRPYALENTTGKARSAYFANVDRRRLSANSSAEKI